MADREIADRPDAGTLMPGAIRDTDAATLGEVLIRARQQRGLTVRDISATTKIPVRHLEALERGDLRAVPGGMYLRAEVRSYADAVGLNRGIALAHLQTALDPPPVAAVAPVAGPATPRRSVFGRAVLAASCLGIGVVAIVMWPSSRQGRETAPSREARETRETAPAGLASEPATASDPVRTASTMSGSTSAPAINAASRPTNDPLPAGATSGTTGSASVPASENALASTDQPAAPTVAHPELEIVTEPAGARVTIDGVGWGVTPVTIRYLSPGNKQLRITRDGFTSEERVIRFGTGQPHTSVRIELHRAE